MTVGLQQWSNQRMLANRRAADIMSQPCTSVFPLLLSCLFLLLMWERVNPKHACVCVCLSVPSVCRDGGMINTDEWSEGKNCYRLLSTFLLLGMQQSNKSLLQHQLFTSVNSGSVNHCCTTSFWCHKNKKYKM